MDDTGRDLVGRRRELVGPDEDRRRRRQVGADQHLGAGRVTHCDTWLVELCIRRQPRPVLEGFECGKAGSQRDQIELILERRHQTHGQGQRIVHRRGDAVELRHDHEPDRQRRQQPSRTQRGCGRHLVEGGGHQLGCGIRRRHPSIAYVERAVVDDRPRDTVAVLGGRDRQQARVADQQHVVVAGG